MPSAASRHASCVHDFHIPATARGCAPVRWAANVPQLCIRQPSSATHAGIRHTCSAGHHQVVRPPIVARSISAPQRGQQAAAPARRDDRARVHAALPDGRSRGGPDRYAQPVKLLLAQLVGRAARVDPRAPQRLVGEQVADAGDHRLVHDPRLDRRAAARDARAERRPRHLGGVGTEALDLRLQARAPEAPLVAQDEAAAVGEAQREAVPHRVGALAVGLGVARRRVVDDDPTGHPEVQAEHGPIPGGLQPHRLAAAVGVEQPAADERVGDLARRVRAADVRVGVVDGDDLAVQRALGDQRAGSLDLGQLRHRRARVERGSSPHAPTRRLPAGYEARTDRRWTTVPSRLARTTV